MFGYIGCIPVSGSRLRGSSPSLSAHYTVTREDPGGTKMDTVWCWPTGRLVQERTTLKAGVGCGRAQRPGIN